MLAIHLRSITSKQGDETNEQLASIKMRAIPPIQGEGIGSKGGERMRMHSLGKMEGVEEGGNVKYPLIHGEQNAPD